MPREMEGTTIKFDDAAYDEAVHSAVPSAADIQVIIKDRGTAQGLPIVAITWTSEIEGELVKVQNVMTARMWLSVARAIEGRYPGLLS